MLELRPSCENCEKPLPPSSTEARICSFECTFCARCVDEVLHNVCPNCGGGFTPRPVRPARDHVRGNCLLNYPARTDPVHKPVDEAAQRGLIEGLSGVAPEER